MTSLPSRLTGALSPLSSRELRPRPVPARIERAVHESVALEHGNGIIQAAKVRAVELVANEGMQAVAGLSQLEALHLQRCPLGEARYRTIADTAAVAIASIVAETGRH
ncbi:hypothetical protein [Amycolatopsis sp. CB00013]|uniref:hypothetical protein n=1 Tax=Amycolatopsis sp. CB00013 TaxID=1703945 RepID=UPI00093AB196|nr:hypothetical protein [Amycolatopsis sp. CB00013]